MQIIVVILLSVCLVETYHVPQVYETTNDFSLFGDERKLKESDTESGEKYSRFVYPPAFQKDQLKWRYFQQQIVDAKNIARFNNNRIRAQRHNSFTGVPSVIISSPRRFITKYRVKRLDSQNEKSTKLSRKSRAIEDQNDVNDSLMVESNIEERHFRNQMNVLPINVAKTQQQRQQKTLAHSYKQIVPRKNVYYLTETLSKHPNAELNDLHYILANQPTPMPFHMKHNDNINSETQENVQLTETALPQLILKSGDSLSQLQAHFDALSQVHVEKALAQAHKQAIVEVEAQHQAMLLAKSQAEKAALDQIQRAQAEAETLAYIQSQLQNTQQQQQHEHQPVVTTNVVQQKQVNAKLQNALLHAQKQAQAYQHYSLKTHLPKVDKNFQFKEETSQNKIVPHNDENDVSNLKCLLPNQFYKSQLFNDGKRPKRNTNYDYYNQNSALIMPDTEVDRRLFRNTFKKFRRTRYNKHHHKHNKPIYIPEKHHYYHFIPEKPDKDTTTQESKDGKIIVNINNNNNNNTEKEKQPNRIRRRPKHRKHRRTRYRKRNKPFWRSRPRPRYFHRKLHKAFHKLGVPLK